MAHNIDHRHRRSIRMQGYDYCLEGAYFVTICTQCKECLFGNIENGEMHLSEIGLMVQVAWDELSAHYMSIDTDAFVIMPNHVHGVIVITGECSSSGDASFIPTLGQTVAFLKYQSTKCINAYRDTPALRIWQRNYYEHIIRNEKSLIRIREYIMDNPGRWEVDHDNPDAANPELLNAWMLDKG